MCTVIVCTSMFTSHLQCTVRLWKTPLLSGTKKLHLVSLPASSKLGRHPSDLPVALLGSLHPCYLQPRVLHSFADVHWCWLASPGAKRAFARASWRAGCCTQGQHSCHMLSLRISAGKLCLRICLLQSSCSMPVTPLVSARLLIHLGSIDIISFSLLHSLQKKRGTFMFLTFSEDWNGPLLTCRSMILGALQGSAQRWCVVFVLLCCVGMAPLSVLPNNKSCQTITCYLFPGSASGE